MREILFRGKRIDNGEWVEGAFSAWSCDLPFSPKVYKPSIIKYGEPYSGFWFDVYPDTVGQYTGLTDKNGKKIFEGDVLSIHNSSIGLYVALTEFQWQCLSHENKYYRHRLENNPPKYEVVGNIHDNPELRRERV